MDTNTQSYTSQSVDAESAPWPSITSANPVVNHDATYELAQKMYVEILQLPVS